MLQDKIQHNLIKINKLNNQRESIKYIVPLFFNAIKCIYDNCMHSKIDPFLIDHVCGKFRNFHQERNRDFRQLDQVHTYMIEECIQMLQSRHVQCKSDLKSNILLSKMQKESDLNQGETSETIILPQKTYFVDQNFELISKQSSLTFQQVPQTKLIRRISTESIPDIQHSQLQADNLWSNIVKYYEQHRIDEAKQLCQQYQNIQFLVNPNTKLSNSRYHLIDQIHEEAKMIQDNYNYFNEPGYQFDKEEDGVRMHFKVYQQSKEVAVRVEAQLNISIQRFMCIVSQIDLFQRYAPYAYDTRQLKQISRNQKIGRTKVAVPLLSDRQAYFYAAAYDRLHTHNSIFLFSKTLSNDPKFQQKLNFPVKLDPKLVELVYKFYIMEYVPIGFNRGRIKLATNIDMKIGFLPLFVINKSLRIFAFDFFEKLMEVNKNFRGSDWQKKMNQRPDIYSFFKGRIEEYMSSYRSTI